MENNIQIFEGKKIRSVWDNEKEEWYFSVVDVVGALTDSLNPNNYWKVLKKRLKDEGNELVTNCNRLKIKSHKDGKMYMTDVADIQGIFRLIQSIPSPKAEPFKMWLAEIGKERIDEIIEEHKKEWEEILSNWICNAFEPNVSKLITIYPDEKPFRIKIKKGDTKPYYYKDRRRNELKRCIYKSGEYKKSCKL